MVPSHWDSRNFYPSSTFPSSKLTQLHPQSTAQHPYSSPSPLPCPLSSTITVLVHCHATCPCFQALLVDAFKLPSFSSKPMDPFSRSNTCPVHDCLKLSPLYPLDMVSSSGTSRPGSSSSYKFFLQEPSQRDLPCVDPPGSFIIGWDSPFSTLQLLPTQGHRHQISMHFLMAQGNILLSKKNKL